MSQAPPLTLGEAVELCLNTLGIPGPVHAIEAKFKECNPAFLEDLFSKFVTQVLHIHPSDLEEPIAEAFDENIQDNKEMYKNVVLGHAFMHHLTCFAMAAQIHDFSSLDIYETTFKRTMFILAGFLNFVHFTEANCEPFVQRLETRSKGLQEEKEQLINDLADMQEKIAALKAKIAEDEPRCEQLRIENSNLRSRMFATKELQTKAAADVETLKAEKRSVLNRKAATIDEIKSLADANARTQSRIVQSPERIKRTIKTMNTTVTEDRRRVVMFESKTRDLQAKMNALSAIESDVRGCIQHLEKIEEDVRSLKDSQKVLGEFKDLLDQKQIERNELKLRKERVERQLSNAQEKLERARRHAEEKKAASEKTLERLQKEYDMWSVERKSNDEEVEALRSEADSVEAMMAEHLKKSELELNALVAEYFKLRQSTEVYMETLATKLNMTVSAE